MAHDVIFTATITPNVMAAVDLRAHQHKLVQFGATGVRLASAQGSGGIYVLANKPNSGEACSLLGAPNISRLPVDAATVRGNFLALSATTSGVASPVTSAYGAGFIGVALTAVASGSFVDAHLRG